MSGTVHQKMLYIYISIYTQPQLWPVINWGSSKRVHRNSYMNHNHNLHSTYILRFFFAISPHQHMGLFKHIQKLGYPGTRGTPKIHMAMLGNTWFSRAQRHVSRRLALLHLHCLPWRSQVVLHLPLLLREPKMGNPNLMGWMGLTQSSWSRSNMEKTTTTKNWKIVWKTNIFYLLQDD